MSLDDIDNNLPMATYVVEMEVVPVQRGEDQQVRDHQDGAQVLRDDGAVVFDRPARTDAKGEVRCRFFLFFFPVLFFSS